MARLAERPRDAESPFGESGDEVRNHPIRDQRDLELPVPSGHSSAEQGDLGVAEIRRTQAIDGETRRQELARSIEQARTAERLGRLGAARVRYQQAASRATGDLRRQLLEKLESLRGK